MDVAFIWCPPCARHCSGFTCLIISVIFITPLHSPRDLSPGSPQCTSLPSCSWLFSLAHFRLTWSCPGVGQPEASHTRELPLSGQTRQSSVWHWPLSSSNMYLRPRPCISRSDYTFTPHKVDYTIFWELNQCQIRYLYYVFKERNRKILKSQNHFFQNWLWEFSQVFSTRRFVNEIFFPNSLFLQFLCHQDWIKVERASSKQLKAEIKHKSNSSFFHILFLVVCEPFFSLMGVVGVCETDHGA